MMLTKTQKQMYDVSDELRWTLDHIYEAQGELNKLIWNEEEEFDLTEADYYTTNMKEKLEECRSILSEIVPKVFKLNTIMYELENVYSHKAIEG